MLIIRAVHQNNQSNVRPQPQDGQTNYYDFLRILIFLMKFTNVNEF